MFSFVDLLEKSNNEGEEVKFIEIATQKRKKLYFFEQKLESPTNEDENEEKKLSPEILSSNSEEEEEKDEKIINSQQIDNITFSQLDNNFKEQENGIFIPTDFQKAVLQHMQNYRTIKNHKIGLLVIATGLGKTVNQITH